MRCEMRAERALGLRSIRVLLVCTCVLLLGDVSSRNVGAVQMVVCGELGHLARWCTCCCLAMLVVCVRVLLHVVVWDNWGTIACWCFWQAICVEKSCARGVL